MDRKSKLDAKESEKTPNGDVRSKEKALEKIRQMEWMRNKQDNWHLARASAREGDFQERKKYSKDEESYFEGTATQKNKKARKPRLAGGSATVSVPPGFSLNPGPSGPPPVNAWTQKKGSALFNKSEPEPDEGDEMFKLALKESLITFEEDQKRQQERLLMMNRELVPAAPIMTSPDTDDKIKWEDEFDEEEDPEEEYYSNTPEPIAQPPPKADLQFIDTDSTEEEPAARYRRPGLQRPKKTQSPPTTGSTAGNKNNFNYHESTELHEKYSPPPNITNDGYKTSKPLLNSSTTRKYESNKVIVIPEREISSVMKTTEVDALTANLKSTLTFGDTQDLFEKLQAEEQYRYDLSATTQTLQFETRTPRYEPRSLGNTPEPISPLANNKSAYPESSETDIMLHNFIRHEPPSVVPTYLPQETTHTEQKPFINGLSSAGSQSTLISSNDNYSSSPLSNSPLQNVTPYGSLEKSVLSNGTGNVVTSTQSSQHTLPYHLALQGNQEAVSNLQSMQFPNSPLTPQMPYGSIPQSYLSPNNAVPGMLSINQPPVVPFFQFPTMMSNVHTPPHAYPTHLQQMMAMNAYQFQQARLGSLNIPPSETSDSLQKEQTKTDTSQAQVQPQIFTLPNQTQNISTQNQPQLIAGQNQPSTITNQTQPQLITPSQPILCAQNPPSMVPTQNHHSALMAQSQPQFIPIQNPFPILAAQNQPQMTPPQETTVYKQDLSPNEYQQQNQVDKQSSGMTKEEIMLQYQQALETVNRLRQELVETQAQPSAAPVPQPHPPQYMYPIPPMAMGMSSFYPGMAMMAPVQQQQPHQNVSGLPTEAQDMNMVHSGVELKNGRGRGRIQ